MNEATTTQCVMFPGWLRQPIQAIFDEPLSSSDGGALLLAAADRKLGLTVRLASCLRDERQPGKVRHELGELLRERVYALACGHEDANDAARLAQDPVYKLLVGRDPVMGDALASQPTMSRFEHSVGRAELVSMGTQFSEAVFDRHRARLGRKVRRITLDLDQTHDETHGAQQLALFNGFYRCWCYLPLLGFVSFNGESDQYLFAAVLRSGHAPARQGVLGVLRRALPALRHRFPKAKIRVRLDAGYPSPELLDFLESERVEYVVGFPKNAKLESWTEHLLAEPMKRAEATGASARVYEEVNYAARRWKCPRRVVVKAEVVCLAGRAHRGNLRYVVTNLGQTPRWIYEEAYCQRGDVENRIKELKDGMAIDRTSCTRFLANQFRVLLTATAYFLMQELRLRARRTTLARAQVSSLRDHLLKIGARVSCSVRRIQLHFPLHQPHQHAWRTIARALGAVPG